jgi:hypothetical protein
MFPRYGIGLGLQIGAGVAVMVLCAPVGHAAPTGNARMVCVSAYRTAVKLEQASHLREAQKAFAACARVTCDQFMRKECMSQHNQLDSDIPSVVPVVTDASGEPVVDVRVTMDGEVLTSKIDGRAVAVDPGIHEFSFTTPAGAFTQKLVILQGQRNRPLAIAVSGSGARTAQRNAPAPQPAPVPSAAPRMVQVEPRAAPAASVAPPPEELVSETPLPARTSSRRGSSIAPWVMTGIGLVGVGSYGLLTYWGRKDNDMLVKCSPDCLQTSVDHVKKLYLAANISLGVGVAALATATWLLVRSGKKELAARQSSYALDLQPIPSGAFANVRGAF